MDIQPWNVTNYSWKYNGYLWLSDLAQFGDVHQDKQYIVCVICPSNIQYVDGLCILDRYFENFHDIVCRWMPQHLMDD